MNQLENNQEDSFFEKVMIVPNQLVPFFFFGCGIVVFIVMLPFMALSGSRSVLKELKEEEEYLKNNNL